MHKLEERRFIIYLRLFDFGKECLLFAILTTLAGD
jgi:hypothetical protein